MCHLKNYTDFCKCQHEKKATTRTFTEMLAEEQQVFFLRLFEIKITSSHSPDFPAPGLPSRASLMSFMSVHCQVLSVVSGIWVSVGTLNAPYSRGWMLEYRTAPLSSSSKGCFTFLKPEGEESGGNKRPLLLSLCLSVRQTLFYSLTPLFSLFSLSLLYPASLSLPSLFHLTPSVFLLSFLSCAYISLFSVSSPSYREVTHRSRLTKPIVLLRLWRCNCSPPAIYGHLCYSS